MGASRRNAECAPPQAPPSSSPLSSIDDVDLSDCSQFEEDYLAETRASKVPTPKADAAEAERISPTRRPRPASHRPLHDDDEEDELAGEPPEEPVKEDQDVTAVAEVALNGVSEEKPTSSPAPTRRMPSRQKKIIIKPPPKKAPPRKSVWTAERLLTDPKSPLAKADLRSIVANPMAWDVLDTDTQAEILALFPRQSMVLEAGTDAARPDIAAMMNDDAFRGDCADYTEHIAQGRHDHDWLVSAYKAHERRSVGDFDEFLVQKVYDDWGAELPDDFKPRRPPGVQNGSELQEKSEAYGVNGAIEKDASEPATLSHVEEADQVMVDANQA